MCGAPLVARSSRQGNEWGRAEGSVGLPAVVEAVDGGFHVVAALDEGLGEDAVVGDGQVEEVQEARGGFLAGGGTLPRQVAGVGQGAVVCLEHLVGHGLDLRGGATQRLLNDGEDFAFGGAGGLDELVDRLHVVDTGAVSLNRQGDAVDLPGDLGEESAGDAVDARGAAELVGGRAVEHGGVAFAPEEPGV